MAFLVKALFWWNECWKMLISAFWATSWHFFFQFFFSISRNFVKQYLHAKFQINWSHSTEITEGAESVLPQSYPICKKLSLFRVNENHIVSLLTFLLKRLLHDWIKPPITLFWQQKQVYSITKNNFLSQKSNNVLPYSFVHTSRQWFWTER